MKVDVLGDVVAFDVLHAEWNELLSRSPLDQIFYTWEWHSTWWQAYHPGRLWIVTCRDDQARLVGIAPWFIDSQDIVRTIGCEDVTDYLDIIVDRSCIDLVFQALCTFLVEHKSAYNRIELCNIPQASPTLDRFSDLLTRHQFVVQIEPQEVCPVIELPNEWEIYVESLEKKQRHELRRKLRRIKGSSEVVDWYIVNASHDIYEELECYLYLMASGDLEKRQFLQNEHNAKFFRDFMPIAFANGWLQLCFLVVNGERVAAYLNFDYNNRIMVYNSGLSHEKYSHLSPGIVLLAYTIRYAIENGYKAFDFLRGDEAYKYYLGGKNTFVRKLIARVSPD